MYNTLLDIINDQLDANENNDHEYHEWHTMRSLLTVLDGSFLSVSAHHDGNEAVYLNTARQMLDCSLEEIASLPSMHGYGRFVTVRMERRPLSRIASKLIDDSDGLYYVMARFVEAVVGVMLYADDAELKGLRDKFNFAASICHDLEEMHDAFFRLDDVHEITFVASPAEMYVLQTEIQPKLSRFEITVTPGKNNI